jgi:predicted porin
VSFAINKNQNYGTAAGNITSLNYKDQNYAWQFGAGLDVRSLSVDLRYEAGLSKQSYGPNSTKINLFNLTLGYRLF